MTTQTILLHQGKDVFVPGHLCGCLVGSSIGVVVPGQCHAKATRSLYHGRSERCDTFSNPPLNGSQDFAIASLEVYGFVS